MTNILLVHGSCHGAWCWRDLIPALATHGIDARAIDLPSHGEDTTPPEAVTLDSYADAILAACSDWGDGPTVVLGHSMAGYPITAAAQKDPRKIAALIYLCAYVPVAGKTLADMRRMAPSQPLLDAVRVAPDRVTFTIDPEGAAQKFYHDVAPETARWAVSRLGPQPVLPQETALPDTSRAESLPRHYIRCLDDRTIPPAFQHTMTQEWRGGTVADLPLSHSPFLADPARLARTIADLPLPATPA